MKRRLPALAAALIAVLTAGAIAAAEPTFDRATVERGRYLVTIGQCNDCHTANYPMLEGKVPEAEWLAGSEVGFQGPWGTTYPANLRLALQAMTEAEWLAQARAARRPPMPWFNLAAMSDADLRAMYAYIRHLGPAGKAAPAYAPPGAQVSTPYFEFVPKNLPAVTAAGKPR